MIDSFYKAKQFLLGNPYLEIVTAFARENQQFSLVNK